MDIQRSKIKPYIDTPNYGNNNLVNNSKEQFGQRIKEMFIGNIVRITHQGTGSGIFNSAHREGFVNGVDIDNKGSVTVELEDGSHYGLLLTEIGDGIIRGKLGGHSGTRSISIIKD